MFKKALFTVVIFAMLLAACGGARAPEPQMAYSDTEDFMLYEEEAAEEYAKAPAAPMEDEGRAGGYEVSDSTANVQRMVIKNADVSIIADDPAQSMDEIGKMAEGMGGFIVNSNLYQRTLPSGAEVPQASITIRVPAERLDEALEQIKAGAVDVENASISGQDVTSEYTDLESRLRNLEAAEAQLQEILDEAKETEDVLDVFNQLVLVREQIEVIKGQMKYYEQAAALSMISVSITADEAVQPIQIGGWSPTGTVKDAVEMLIRSLQFLIDFGIWVVLCVLPIGLLIGLPLFFVIRYLNRKRKARKAAQSAGQAASELPPDDAA